jgi:hypothetical protein
VDEVKHVLSDILFPCREGGRELIPGDKMHPKFFRLFQNGISLFISKGGILWMDK